MLQDLWGLFSDLGLQVYANVLKVHKQKCLFFPDLEIEHVCWFRVVLNFIVGH